MQFVPKEQKRAVETNVALEILDKKLEKSHEIKLLLMVQKKKKIIGRRIIKTIVPHRQKKRNRYRKKLIGGRRTFANILLRHSDRILFCLIFSDFVCMFRSI